MSRRDDGVVGKRVQLAADGVRDGAGIAAWQIGATHAAAEERISRDQFFFSGNKQRNAARGVSRRVQHVQFEGTGLQNIAFPRRLIDTRIFRVSQPSHDAWMSRFAASTPSSRCI